jgi:hypothetical protein
MTKTGYGIRKSHTIQGGTLECGHRHVETDMNLYVGRTYICRKCGYELRTLVAVGEQTVTSD